LEYLWKAAGCLFKEGSDELTGWFEVQKDLLYNSKAGEIVEEIESQYKKLPKRGPGMKKRRPS